MANNTQALPASRMLSQPTSCNSCLRFFISSIICLHSEFVSHLIAFLCAKDIRIYHKVQKKKNGEVPSLFYNISLSVNIGEYTIPSQVYMWLYVYICTVSHHAYYIIRFYQSLWWQQRRPKGICSSNPTVILF